MSHRRLLLVSIAVSAFVSASTLVLGQELSAAEKSVAAELKRCPAQNAEKCHSTALQQFETSLRREFSTPGAAYWTKVLGALKRHSVDLDADIRAAEKRAPTGATGNAASGASTLEACLNAGGTRAQCYYWVIVLGGGR